MKPPNRSAILVHVGQLLLVLQPETNEIGLFRQIITHSNQSEGRGESGSTEWVPTEALVGVQAGELHGSVVALLGVLLVRDVDPTWTVAVGQAVVCQVDLRHRQKSNLVHKADT